MEALTPCQKKEPVSFPILTRRVGDTGETSDHAGGGSLQTPVLAEQGGKSWAVSPSPPGDKGEALDFTPGLQLRLNPQQVWSLGELLNPPPETGWVTGRSRSQDAGTGTRGRGRYNSSPQ